MAIVVKGWQRRSLSLPSPRIFLALSFHWLFQEELCTRGMIFHPLSFFTLDVRMSHLLMGMLGRKNKKKESDQTET